jgi:pyruvate/2-oxoglutarate dehydrogenase complex dihydrolipoamide dehydrogenase (E3) component
MLFVEADSKPGVIGSVVLENGSILVADLVLLAMGTKPATGFLKKSGVILCEDGSVEVDGKMRVKGVGRKKVFAIGGFLSSRVCSLKTFILNLRTRRRYRDDEG